MKNYRIFTIGDTVDMSYHKQMEWREKLETSILDMSDKSITFIHLPMFYDNNSIKTKEARDWVINQLKESDIVVVNLKSIDDSIESLFELGIITAINSFAYKNISVVDIGDTNTNHSWVQLSLNHTEKTIEETADYIINYLLV